MTHCIIDGSGLYGMVKFARRRIKMQTEPQLYHGADLVEDLFAAYQDGSKKFFFLGNAEGVAQTACKAIRNRFPRIQIVGATDGGMIDINNPVNPALLTEIEALGTDILFVGFGAPKQETWINVAKDSKIQVMIGVGGTLNFYTNKSRAPKWMQVIHMEWLFRSLTEKGHFKRAFRGVFVFPIKSLFSFFGK
jgi:N-acetylglucosaminyldiphosphoundecaprenol N-acetyl-beta-D-mannosaminyltransferase